MTDESQAVENVRRNMDPVPEQDVRFSDPAAPPTPWPEVLRVLETAELFWISTVRRTGRPHVTPLPAVWHDDRLHFCTGPAEQKAVNGLVDLWRSKYRGEWDFTVDDGMFRHEDGGSTAVH